jgi:hypothetical protein
MTDIMEISALRRRSILLAAPLALLAVLACALAAAVPAAAAGGYGQLLRFNGKGTDLAKPGSELQFEGEEAHAFAVEPTSGRIYVGTESSETSEKLRIQSYSSAGAYEGEALIKPPTLPGGMSFEVYEGFAVDAKEGRIYALDTFKRFAEAGIDGNDGAAGALYAFKSVPSAGRLEPAEGTGKEGLLGTTESLGASSEAPGVALLEPSGITVDPLTNEVLILGLADEGGGALHPAVEHVSSSGHVLFTWVDPEVVAKAFEPDSPVVSAGGKLFFESGDELLALPAASRTGAPELVFSFAEPESLDQGPFAGELLAFGEGETGYGGGLSIVAEGASSGRLVAFAEITEMSEAGKFGGEGRNGAVGLSYVESGEHVTVTEAGWTGGVPGEGQAEAAEKKEPVRPCEIGFANANPLVAAAPGEVVYVLAPGWAEVIKLGPGGSGCPTAHAAPAGLEVTLAGKRVADPETSDTVTLSAKVVQADVLSVKWVFGDGQEALVTTPGGEQTQTAETTHKFAKTGKLTVEAIIHTDNLATPEVREQTAVDVIESGTSAPTVTREPGSPTVVEGDAATFQAGAAGEPEPTVQWEESSDGGKEWKTLTSDDSTTLTLADVTLAQSGHEFRATFTNSAGAASSEAGTLTVETVAAHEEKEGLRKKREQEESEKSGSTNPGGGSKTPGGGSGAPGGGSGSPGGGSSAPGSGVAGYKEAAARASLAGSSLAATASGAVAMKVACPAGVSTCKGTVTLRTASAVSARAGKKKSVLTLGVGSFSVGGGQVKALTLHLSAQARSLLAHSHSLRVRVTVVASNAAGEEQTVLSTVTLKLAKHR